jgi:hypothetical protein
MTQRALNGIMADVMRRAGIKPVIAQRMLDGKWIADEPVDLEGAENASEEASEAGV